MAESSPQYQLLTLDSLASLLHKPANGLRSSLKRDTEFARRLKNARVKLGRRVYFRSDLIDRLIIESTGV